MPASIMQKSFNSGEWAPNLYSRVDLDKYHSGLALGLNWNIDYRGGAFTRQGSQYILQCFKSATPVRLIPFIASTTVTYMLEFGDQYIRFYNNGAPILEATVNNITGATRANPCTLTVANSYASGDWVFVSGVGGMTQLNGNYYQVGTATGTTITLQDLNGNPIDSTAFSAYTSGGTTERVYTLASPYLASEVFQINFAQEITTLVLCHPNHPTQLLTLIAFNNWTIAAAAFGSTASAPSSVVLQPSSQISGGSSPSTYYSYVATAVFANGDESIASTPTGGGPWQDLRTTFGSIQVVASKVTGAVSYNWYKSDVSYFNNPPAGVPYGFIGNTTGLQIIDSNITADFSITPPIGSNPFTGTSVASITQNTTGTYTIVPAVYVVGGNPNQPAVAQAVLQVQGTPTVGAAGTGYVNGDTITLSNGVIVTVNTVGGGGAITSFYPISHGGSSPGSLTAGSTPTNPVAQVSTSGGGSSATVNLVWGVGITQLINGGIGYQSTPTIQYSSGSATATATLASATSSNPTVPGFFQQRLVLAAAANGPETLDFSQPGSYYNFNVSNPVQADNAISATLASGQLETIQSLVPTAVGLIIFTDKSSWLLTGGALGSAISPSAIVANRQSLVGAAAYITPLLINFDLLYVEEKGCAVRDANYNYYAQVFTGADISVISSHLFLNYEIVQWTWAQAPYRIVWAVRNDGVLLSLTFSKEEDFIAWTHHTTQGLYKSVASIPEVASTGEVLDAVYMVVQRTINDHTVQYVERIANRILNGQVKNAWSVDAGLQYNGPPATTFTGAQQLAGATVTGIADGAVIAPFVMPANGTFTLSSPASLVTVGLPYTCQLQTLPIDVGSPTIQGKQKKISAVTVRVVDTLGLSIGQTFGTLVPMQDFIVGNVGSLTNQLVTDLVTGDGVTYIDPMWAEQGQFCIQQSLPYPATVTGVVPRLTVDGK